MRGRSPIAACSAAWSEPATSAWATSASARRARVESPPDGLGAQRARRQVQGMLTEDLARGDAALEVRDDLAGDLDHPEAHGGLALEV